MFNLFFKYKGMKRGADKEMGSPLKRARNLGHELRILIPSRVRIPLSQFLVNQTLL